MKPESSSQQHQKQLHEESSQREQLNRSEREAKRTQPENYQEYAAAEKVVSTERGDQHEVGAIQGLDNKPRRSQRNKS